MGGNPFNDTNHPFGLFKITLLSKLNTNQACDIGRAMGMGTAALYELRTNKSYLVSWLCRNMVDGDIGLTEDNVDTLFKYVCGAGACSKSITSLFTQYKQHMGLTFEPVLQRHAVVQKAAVTGPAANVTQTVNIYQTIVSKKSEKEYPAGGEGLKLKIEDKLVELKKVYRNDQARIAAEAAKKIRKIQAAAKKEKKEVRTKYEAAREQLEEQKADAEAYIEEELVNIEIWKEREEEKRKKKEKKRRYRKRIARSVRNRNRNRNSDSDNE